jgi:AraC-like DNA-binding protein
VSELTGRVLSLQDAFGSAGVEYEESILGAPDDDCTIVALAEEFLRSLHPRSDEALGLVTRAMTFVEQERGVTRVSDLAAALGVTVRTLQRLFGERVGVSPKWVINRARLQDAAARVMAGRDVNWSRLALELGFFDQAHLIRAYRRIIGVAPAEHARRTHDTSAGEQKGCSVPAAHLPHEPGLTR